MISNGKIDSKMNYINSQNQSVNISAIGYITSETGNINTFTEKTVISSSYNQCYLVFDGHRDIKKIQSIKISQEVVTIRARMVFAEVIERGGQHQNICYGKEEKTLLERDLPVPAGTVIKVIKRDSDNGVELKNAQFVLKNLTTGQYAVGGKNTIPYNTWTSNIASATTYQSGDRISLEKSGVYQFYEIQAQNEFYKSCSKTEAGKLAVGNQIVVNIGNYSEVTLKNQPLGYIILSKLDETRRNELNNTRFVIKRIDTGQYARGGTGKNEIATWVNNIKEASIYSPKQKICFQEKVRYQVYEVQRQSESYEYCSIDLPLAVGNIQTVIYRANTTVTLTNKRKYIKISGYVWEDMPYSIDKDTKYDHIYDTNIAPDKRVANIKVVLKDKAGNVINTRTKGAAVTTTKDVTGAYSFEEVEIERLRGGGYLEFTYNGMAYRSVELKPNLTNGSKVSDEGQREEFNGRFAKIENSQATGNQGTIGISYDRKEHTSTLNYEGGYYGYTGQKYPIAGMARQYEITADTRKTGFLGQTLIAIDDIYKKGIDEMSNINLGIIEREQPDLSMVKDIEKAEVRINGATHVYQYADRFNKDLWEQSGYEMEPQVKFESKYGNMSYTRALYASDVYYSKKEYYEEDKQLQVKVTYKIGIKNGSNNLISIINELDDYYDSKYESDKEKINIMKQELDQSGKVITNEKLEYDIEKNYHHDEYTKIKIKNANLNIKPQSEGYILVELEVKPDQIVELIKEENTKLDNIAEISSYTTKDKQGKIYAGIDQDSNPGNSVIGKTNTYEDDIDRAPGLKLVLQEARKIDGKVFLDHTTGELKTGEMREGDGIYQEEEKGIQGVKVKLIHSQTEEPAQKYEGKDETGEWEEAIVETKEDGSYELSGLLPENYKIIYEWGGQTYEGENGEEKEITVQNYKGTIYQEKDKREEVGEKWYQYKPEIRYSDAMDCYETRKKIDAQTRIITNENQEIIKKQRGEIVKEDGSKESLITKMESTTPIFKVGIEYDEKETDHKAEYDLKDGAIQLDHNGFVKKKEEMKNYLKNVDFGIVERARQALSLDKVIKEAKLMTANGNIIADVEIVTDENGKRRIKDDIKHAVYIPSEKGNDGQIKFEIDGEIVQSAKLEIEYSLRVDNISELDYNNEQYYFYGSKQGYQKNANELITLKASSIIDYIDNTMTNDSNFERAGDILEEVGDKSKLFEEGLLDNRVKSFVNQTNKILLIESLSKELKPIGGEVGRTSTDEVTIRGSKLLANNEDRLLENNAEIIKVEKVGGGATLVSTPGNYIPRESEHECDDAQSESINVVPPTGLSVDYIAYTLLAISSLGILTSGIILIKKYVLK